MTHCSDVTAFNIEINQLLAAILILVWCKHFSNSIILNEPPCYRAGYPVNSKQVYLKASVIIHDLPYYLAILSFKESLHFYMNLNTV